MWKWATKRLDNNVTFYFVVSLELGQQSLRTAWSTYYTNTEVSVYGNLILNCFPFDRQNQFQCSLIQSYFVKLFKKNKSISTLFLTYVCI